MDNPFGNPNLPWLTSVPRIDDYTSPFPSNDAKLSLKFQALESAGGAGAGNIARRSGTAWTDATQIAMKAKAVFAGDLRMDWLGQLVKQDPQSQAFTGLFAQVNFPSSDDPVEMEKAIVNTAFNVADTILSAIPVYGQILGAVVDAGQFLYNLFRQPEDQQEIEVPWQEYSRDTDEDIIRNYVGPMFERFDWTSLYWPALDWTVGFRSEKTEKGDKTRAWGTFQNGTLRYTDGLGMMPGTQRMADAVQMVYGGAALGPTSRTDIITSVGDFYPATAQFGTATWAMVNKAGSPDMFKIRAGELRQAWDAYFDAMRASFADQWNSLWGKGDKMGDVQGNADLPEWLGKLVSPFVYIGDQLRPNLEGVHGRWNWPGMSRSTGKWRPKPDDDDRPYCPSNPYVDAGHGGWGSDLHYQAGRYYPPDRCSWNNPPSSIKNTVTRWVDTKTIKPVCRTLQKRQLAALYRTVVCAYVRPRAVGNMPAYSAFTDDTAPLEDKDHDTFGKELIARCERARDLLLTLDLRFTIRLENVDAVDPPYAAKLRASGVKEDSWKHPPMKITAGPPVIQSIPAAPAAKPPTGGAPFRVHGRRMGGGGGGLIIAGAAAVAAFAAIKARS